MLTTKFGYGKGLRTSNKANDKILTPEPIARAIINLFPIYGTVLDPFYGKGAFYDNFPETVKKEWCEIEMGKDFFDYTNKVNWIISNPPYSILDEVLDYSYEIANNIVYLISLSKLWTSMGRIRKVFNYGGIRKIYILSASRCGFPFGFLACAVWLQKGYKGETKIMEIR